MLTQKSRVHNALVSLAQNGEFYPVCVQRDGALKGQITLGKLECPKSVSTDEKAGAWEEGRNRRTLNRDRADWAWDLHLAFKSRIDASRFEEKLTQPVLVLPHIPFSDNQPALRSVQIILEGASYSHPPAEATNGSKITYSLVARETHR